MKRNYLFYWFAVLLCLTVPAQSFATIYNGSCGENVNWSLDTETGLLEITGSGVMEDYGYTPSGSFCGAPWFKYRSNIKECVIENGVTSIGDYAFYNCTGLTSITIPESATSIGSSAFSSCSGLTSITIPESVTSIGDEAFHGCSGLTSVTWNAISCTSFSSSTFDGIKEKITSFTFGDKVQTIPANLCSGMSNLTNITIPNSVTSIGDEAFYDCYRLTDITIPNSVTTIGNDAFKNTLWYRNQPDGEIYVGSCFYKYKGTMPQNSTINIKEGTTCISSSAFSGCTGLTDITIPESVTSIGDEAFSGCTELTNITIPNSVTSIGNDAFIKTPWYKNQPDGEIYVGSCFYKYKGTMPRNSTINIKEGTTCISSSAFSGYTELTNITIPNSVTSIGDYAFSNCTRLTDITIPENVTSIGNYAFSGCTKLTNITIPNSVTSIGESTFYDCTGLTSITIPESVTSIGLWAFYHCTKLTNITIPNSVTSIGLWAFQDCSGLTNVTIGNSVKIIALEAFSGCKNIKNIYCHSQEPPKCYDALYSIDKFDCTLYVPEGKESAYMNAEGWKEFFFIEEITGIDAPKVDKSGNATFDIYDMSGRMVRKGATTTDGLKAGLYIINGRKVLVK
ncbi:MAG: leucine-rich repeat domain-containing protein [Paraprevotella sp.]|nr:leucine-rich repeat domain-containing protein [Paraprevotella sp.]